MTRASVGSSRVGRPERLNRRLILDTAVSFVEERGLAQLSMRRLAAALGVQAMSLYPHVPGREDLLDGMVETVVDQLYSDPEVFLEPRHGWEDYLRRVAYGLRRIAFAHPHLFPLVATRPPAAPWVRPPLRSLRWVNSFLAGLIQSGFSDRSAAATYRAFTSFLLGHLLLDVSGRAVDVTAAADSREGLPGNAGNGERSGDPGAGRATDPLLAYPELRRLREHLTEDTSDREFQQSLDNLFDRLRELHHLDNPDDVDGRPRVGDHSQVPPPRSDRVRPPVDRLPVRCKCECCDGFGPRPSRRRGFSRFRR